MEKRADIVCRVVIEHYQIRVLPYSDAASGSNKAESCRGCGRKRGEDLIKI